MYFSCYKIKEPEWHWTLEWCSQSACHGVNVKTTTTKGKRKRTLLLIILCTWPTTNSLSGTLLWKGWFSSCKLTSTSHGRGIWHFPFIQSCFFLKHTPQEEGGSQRRVSIKCSIKDTSRVCAGPLPAEVSTKAHSDLESRRNKTAFGDRRNEEEVKLVVPAVRIAEEVRRAEKTVRKRSLHSAWLGPRHLVVVLARKNAKKIVRNVYES